MPIPIFQRSRSADYPNEMAHSGYASAYADPAQRSLAMRLRIKVFLGVLLASLLLGQAYNFSREPIYQAHARAQITPPGKVASGDALADAMNADSKQTLLIEVEVLNSRLLLTQVAERLQKQGLLPGTAADPVQALQNMLKINNIEGTPIVQVQAQGVESGLLAPLLNTLLEVYRSQQVLAGVSSTQTQLEAAQGEVKVIDAKLAEKRRALEAQRLRANIVSGERDENQTLSRLKGLNTSLSAATDREATAEGRVHALEQAIAEGKRLPMAKDNPTVAGIEARLSQMKEEWRALQRQFTPQYLEMDANARSLKTRISNLEQQLESERQKSQQMALADAREELAGAQATAQRLRQQIAGDRQEVNNFSRNFGQFQSLQEELKSLELVSQTARQKLLALQASDVARKPRLLILEPAVMPASPSAPLYWRDAAIGTAAALVLSFLAVWFVEFFNRKELAAPAPTTVVLPQPWMLQQQAVGVPYSSAVDVQGLTHHAASSATQLLATALPRELDAQEVSNLLQAAAPHNRAVLVCLLCGLRPEEVLNLQAQHLDVLNGVLRVPGDAPRVLPLPEALRVLAERNNAEASQNPHQLLFTDSANTALTSEDVHAIVTSSAFDADLSQAQSITPAALRHTYIAFLVKQGLRFSELGQLVGRLSTEALNALAPLAQVAASGARVGAAEVQQLLPALRTGL